MYVCAYVCVYKYTNMKKQGFQRMFLQMNSFFVAERFSFYIISIDKLIERYSCMYTYVVKP